MNPPDTESALLLFALGMLDEEESARVRQSLASDPSVRAALRTIEHALGVLGPAALRPISPSADVRRMILDDCDPTGGLSGFAQRVGRLFDVPEETAVDLLCRIHTNGVWTPFVPGVTLLHLQGGPATSGADTGFVRLEPGARLPLHAHKGAEHQLVLSGTLREESGRIAHPGDIWHMPAASSHSFSAVGELPCIAAVVLFTGLEFLEGNYSADTHPHE